MLKLRLDGRPYQYIADRAGLTRQRIQQILSPPIPVRDFVVGKYDGYCANCGIYVGRIGHVHHKGANEEEDYNDIDNLILLCASCHRRRHSNSLPSHCLNCGKVIKGRVFCNKECLRQYHERAFRKTLVCSYCGKDFSLGTSVAYWRRQKSKSGLCFCSRECFYKWQRGKRQNKVIKTFRRVRNKIKLFGVKG